MPSEQSGAEPFPAGFDPLDPEVENMQILCANCDTVERAEDMEVVVDRTDSQEDDTGKDVVLKVERQYCCSQDCAMELMFGGFDV